MIESTTQRCWSRALGTKKAKNFFHLFVGTPTNRATAFQGPLQPSHIRYVKVATIKSSLHVGILMLPSSVQAVSSKRWSTQIFTVYHAMVV